MSRVLYSNKITPQDLEDIVVTAFEGGINYWATSPDAHLAQDKEGYVLPCTITEFEGGSHTLTYSKVKAGVAKAADFQGLAMWNFLENHDAEDADLVIQFALFGEAKYS